MFALCNGVTTHYTLEGNAQRPLVTYVNSLGTDLHSWDQVALALRPKFRTLRYDKRGHGLSDVPEGPYKLADFAGDLKSLLDHLNVETTALVGISIGGQIAMQFAGQFPEAVGALVLANTAAKVGTALHWQERMEKVSSVGLEAFADSIIPVWFSSSFAGSQPATHRGYLNMLKRTSTAGYVASCGALERGDLTDRVGRLTGPTLVLAGDQDQATPPDLVRQLADAIPNARYEEIAQAGHLTCVEQPEAVASAIESFLEEAGYV